MNITKGWPIALTLVIGSALMQASCGADGNEDYDEDDESGLTGASSTCRNTEDGEEMPQTACDDVIGNGEDGAGEAGLDRPWEDGVQKETVDSSLLDFATPRETALKGVQPQSPVDYTPPVPSELGSASNWRVGETHNHSNYSSDGNDEWYMMFWWYEMLGYDWAALTDHADSVFSMSKSEYQQERQFSQLQYLNNPNFAAIIGYEAYTDHALDSAFADHIGCIFSNEVWIEDYDITGLPYGHIKEVINHGGFSSINHPGGNTAAGIDTDDMPMIRSMLGVKRPMYNRSTGVEVHNGSDSSFDDLHYRVWIDELLKQGAIAYPLSVNDAHAAVSVLPNVATVVYSSSLSNQSIVNALKAGTLYATTGPGIAIWARPTNETRWRWMGSHENRVPAGKSYEVMVSYSVPDYDPDEPYYTISVMMGNIEDHTETQVLHDHYYHGSGTVIYHNVVTNATKDFYIRAEVGNQYRQAWSSPIWFDTYKDVDNFNSDTAWELPRDWGVVEGNFGEWDDPQPWGTGELQEGGISAMVQKLRGGDETPYCRGCPYCFAAVVPEDWLMLVDTSSSSSVKVEKLAESSKAKKLKFRFQPFTINDRMYFSIGNSSADKSIYQLMVSYDGSIKYYNGTSWITVTNCGPGTVNMSRGNWTTITVYAYQDFANLYVGTQFKGTVWKAHSGNYAFNRARFATTNSSRDQAYLDDVEFSNTAYVDDPGFENQAPWNYLTLDTSPWKFNGNGVAVALTAANNAYAGNQYATIMTGPYDMNWTIGDLYQLIPVKKYKNYRISAVVQTSSNHYLGLFQAANPNSGVALSSQYIFATSQWTQMSAEFNSGSLETIKLSLMTQGSPLTSRIFMYVDEVRIVELP